MSKIIINQDKIADESVLKGLCPFDAIESVDGIVSINEACKMCKICIKKGPEGAFVFQESIKPKINKDDWRDLVVFVEYSDGVINPVTFELIGKARELADKIGHKVKCLFMGHNITDGAEELLHYGADEVYVYDYEQLKDFTVEPYTAVFEDFINVNKPSIVLVGGTNVGRSLAPRIATRCRSGLTADCTILDIQQNTNLDQIRPAFGGNIMAHILTDNHRPQFATVRYKIFDMPDRKDTHDGKVVKCTIDTSKLTTRVNVLSINHKEKTKNLEDAEVIVVAGRAFKKQEDLKMVFELADLLGAEVAGTRPLVESGWIDGKKQIGLSGRTVKPKLIIACGVSGTIQFVAGMNGSDNIVAINSDKDATIFNVAHIGIVGNIYEVVPKLIEQIKNGSTEMLKA